MSNMVSYFKRIADAVEKLAEGSSSDESTTARVEIYGGSVQMYNTPIDIVYLSKFEQQNYPEYSDFVVPEFMPGSEESGAHGLQNVAFFKKVDDTTGDISYITFFFSGENNPIANADGDIVIQVGVLYGVFVFLEVSKIPEEDEVTLQISRDTGAD